MHLRSIPILIVLLVLPLFALADKTVSLEKGDFVSAQIVSKNESTIVKAKLSPAGITKFRNYNKKFIGKALHSEIGGVTSDFKLRVPIQGDELEMGPYSHPNAVKVADEINKK